MIWEFADGTAVELGGAVSGGSKLARVLRECVRCLRKGWPGPRFTRAVPSGSVPVDLNNAHHVNQMVRDTARCLRVEVLSAPALPMLEWDGPRADHSNGEVVH